MSDHKTEQNTMCMCMLMSYNYIIIIIMQNRKADVFFFLEEGISENIKANLVQNG